MKNSSKTTRTVLFAAAGAVVMSATLYLSAPAPSASVAAGVTAQTEAEQAADPALVFVHGDARLAAGDLAGARAAYQRVVELEPTNAAALLRLAQLEARAGELPAALAAVEQAAELQPDCQVAAVTLAGIQLERGEIEAAEAALATVEPGPAQRLAQAQLTLRAGDAEAGLEQLQAAVDERPNDLAAHLAAARAAEASGHWDEARLFLGRAVELDASYDVRVRYAAAIAASDRIAFEAELLAQLEVACELEPERPEAFAQLAQHHLALNEPEQAEAVTRLGRERCGERFDAALTQARQG